MKYSAPAVVGAMVVVYTIACTAGCNPPKASQPSAVEPAEVAHHVEEESLNTIKLTEKAEQRLGIVLAEVQFTPMHRRRAVGGEVIVPPGQTVVVSSPMAGTLSVPEDTTVPSPGSKLVQDQPVFLLKPLLTPERDVLTPAERVRVAQTKADVATAQIEARRQVESAKIAVESARIAYERTVALLASKAGSQRSVDEAQAKLQLAQQAEETAAARHGFLASVQLDEQAGELGSYAITSPVDGILQSVEAAVGETVTAGKQLFRLIQTDQIWVRVPVYVGQYRNIDVEQPAWISEYGEKSDSQPRTATYVAAPPSANANATTIDLHYELANEDGHWYPGQKLAVSLPVRGDERRLVVPFRSVLYDIHGGAWVYEQIGPRVYARHRVAVEYVEGPHAVLASGPQPGAKVVTDGAAELFGTEFGVGH